MCGFEFTQNLNTMARSAEDILKEAILLESRGKAFYKNVAEKCENEAAKQVFVYVCLSACL